MGNRECEFNLLDEPWIKVMKRDGTIDEVSILTVFEQAHLYTDLAGELATQNVAVLRLLLAVLHTVFSRVDEHGEDAPIEETDHGFVCCQGNGIFRGQANWRAVGKQQQDTSFSAANRKG